MPKKPDPKLAMPPDAGQKRNLIGVIPYELGGTKMAIG